MSLRCSKFFTVSHWAEDEVEGSVSSCPSFCVPLASAATPPATPQGPSAWASSQVFRCCKSFSILWFAVFLLGMCVSPFKLIPTSPFGPHKCHFLTENFSEHWILTEDLSVIPSVVPRYVPLWHLPQGHILCVFICRMVVFSTRCKHCPGRGHICHFRDENTRREMEARNEISLNFLPWCDEIQSCVLYSDLVLFNITVDKMGDC